MTSEETTMIRKGDSTSAPKQPREPSTSDDLKRASSPSPLRERGPGGEVTPGPSPTPDPQPPTPGEAFLRLFVAIELPESWKQALGALQTDMQGALARDPALARTRVRWVRPDGIHLTLKFLGNVASGRLAAIERAMNSAVPESPGLEFSLAAAGSFSDRRAPRVIWASINIAPDYRLLHQLFERIETWLAAAGFPRERRSFAPHLTLARLPEDIDIATRQGVADVTRKVAIPQVDPLVVDHVSLMRSHLGPGGARYERLGRYPPS